MARRNVRTAAAIFFTLAMLARGQGYRGKPDEPLRPDLEADRATHVEGDTIDVPFQRLGALCLDNQDRLLACDTSARAIKVIDSAGKLVQTIQLDFGPEAIAVARDGTVYCGGAGKLAKLDETGKVLLTGLLPADSRSLLPKRRRGSGKGTRVSGMAVSDEYVFATFGSGWSLGAKAKLFRFDRNLKNAKMLAKGLRGCCQRCDITLRNGVVYLAENAAHRVVKYDFEGKVLGKWGSRSRTKVEGFGSCCNPMNLCFGPDGSLYTSESGVGRVKRFSVDGTFLDLVGYSGVARFSRASGFAASCSNIAIAVPRNGDRVYVMDYRSSKIRVLIRKP